MRKKKERNDLALALKYIIRIGIFLGEFGMNQNVPASAETHVEVDRKWNLQPARVFR